jgi:hypothetical protein
MLQLTNVQHIAVLVISLNYSAAVDVCGMWVAAWLCCWQVPYSFVTWRLLLYAASAQNHWVLLGMHAG